MGILYNRYTDDAIDLTGYSGKSWCSAVAPRVNTSGMTDMSYMFNEQKTATSIDVSKFDTSNVTKMEYLFYECQALTSLDLVSFDTTNVTTMTGMFNGCRKLTAINNLSKLTTSNVTAMTNMFYNFAHDAAAPISLDLSTFRTPKLNNAASIFTMNNHQLRIGYGANRGRPRFPVDERHFAKEVTAFQETEDRLAPIDAGHVDLHRPRSNQVQRLHRTVAFEHHGFVAVEVLDNNQVGEQAQLLFRQFREKVYTFQETTYIAVHFLLLLLDS